MYTLICRKRLRNVYLTSWTIVMEVSQMYTEGVEKRFPGRGKKQGNQSSYPQGENVSMFGLFSNSNYRTNELISRCRAGARMAGYADAYLPNGHSCLLNQNIICEGVQRRRSSLTNRYLMSDAFLLDT